jgi:ABC-type transport system involved in multi-copper enzyme maturation permease subunit
MITSVSRAAAMRGASIVTGINVLVASGFSFAAIVSPQSVLPNGDTPSRASQIFALYAAARTIPLALFALVAIYRQSAKALLVLGALAGVVQLLDAGVGAFQGDAGKTVGPLVIAALQFVSVFFVAMTIDANVAERGRGL